MNNNLIYFISFEILINKSIKSFTIEKMLYI